MFDVAGAKAAGYTDDEIADYLGKQSNFDSVAARNSGYTARDIIDHLTTQQKPPQVQFSPVDVTRGPGGEVTGVTGVIPEPGLENPPEVQQTQNQLGEAAKRSFATGFATAPNQFKQFLYVSQLASMHQQAADLEWRQSQHPDADFSAERQSLAEATQRVHDKFEENKRPIDIANEFVKEATPEDTSIAQDAVISFANSAPLLLSGLAGGTLFGPRMGMAIGAGAGGGVQAGQTAGEAMEKGAHPSVAFGAGLTNGILEGLGEYLGLGKVFEASKGGLTKLAAAVGYGATQEGVTQFLQDVVSKVSYDPNLSVQEMGRNAAVAFLAGAMGGGLGVTHQAAVSKAHEMVSDFIKSPEQRALESAHLEGTQNLEALKAQREELNTKLAEYAAGYDPKMAADLDTANKLAAVNQLLGREYDDSAFKTNADQVIREIGMQPQSERRRALDQYRRDLGAQLTKGLPAELDDTQMQGNLSSFLGSSGHDIFGPVGSTPLGRFMNAEEFLTDKSAGTILTVPRVQEEVPTLSKYAEALQTWAQKFDPSLRFILTTRILEPGLSARGAVVMALPNNTNDYFVYLNPKNLNDPTSVVTLAHELGHALTSKLFYESPKHVQEALTRAWKEDVTNAVKSNLTLQQFEQATAVEQGRLGEGPPLRQEFTNFWDKGVTQAYPRYFMNFQEWSAHQMERALVGDFKGMQSDTKSWVREAIAKLKTIYNSLVRPIQPNQTFREFMEYHLTEQAIRNQTRRLAEIEGAAEIHGWQLPRDAAIDTLNEDQQRDLVIPGDESRQGPGGPAAPSSFSRKVASFLKNYFTSEKDTSDFRGDLDKFSRFKQLTASLLYIAQQNRHIRQLYDPLGTADPATGRVQYGYVNLVEMWHNDKMKRMANANDTLKLWNKLSPEEKNSLNRFMLDQVLEKKFYVPTDPNVVAKYGLNDNVVGMFNRLRADFVEVVDSLEQILLKEAEQRLMGNPTMPAQLQEIRDRFTELRARPYFPLTRFGKYVILVRAGRDITIDGQDFKAGAVIYREHFDTKVERAAALDSIKGRWRGHDVKQDVISQTVQSYGALPREILEQLKTRLDLTEEQRDELNKYLLELAPAQSYSKHLMERRGIQGFSMDLQRAYANYMMQASNYLARVKYAQPLRESIRALQATANSITGDSSVRREIANYITRHYDYIMSPENDWAALRGAIAISYLGFMPKSALVNLLQVPMVAYPHLAAIHGDAKALSALGKAYGDVARMYQQLRPLNETEQALAEKWLQGATLTPAETQFIEKWTGLKIHEYDALNKWLEERAVLQEAKNEGFIDEALAMELAGLAHGGMMSKLTATTKTGAMVRTFSHIAMMPFEMAERMNRRVTFMAAYRLALESGLDTNRAFVQAKEAVRQTQFEYAKYNRPELMRGKKGILFMFMQYQLSMLYFLAGGDKGWWRAMAMLLLAAGPLGLPFARNLMDVLEAVMAKLHPNVKIDLEEELKRWVGSIVDSPDIWLHGISRYGFGIIPWADLSGSMSMGRILPGTDVVKHLTEGQDFNAAIRDSVSEAGGATSALMMRMLQAATSNDPDVWRRIERGMPITAGQQVMTALRWWNRGGETDSKGAMVKPLDPNDPYQAAEIIGKALGFNPREVAQAKEDQRLRQDFVNYYLVRRQLLLKSLNFAITQDDMRARELAINAITTYNDEVPFKSMTIKSQEIRSSIQQHAKARALQEAVGTSQKRGIEISTELQGNQ